MSSAPGKHSPADKAAFRRACARFATGVTVVTTRAADGAPHGLTVSSFTAVSTIPPLVLICIDHGCRFISHFRASPYFAVNILRDTQEHLSVRFSELEAERFDGLEWSSGATGVPLLAHALGYMECEVTQVVEVGDHAVFIGQVLHTHVEDGEPLIYYRSSYRRLAD